ncbi:MAG: large conductance mechanosensitive channel protein MscL [Acidobacteriota bacterium]|nr:large conductance mechanosensitive channel protein MscL [Acidobacteriota bacterium]
MLKEFRDFIARGNVIDLAVAVILGAAFGRIVMSLVDGILMPPIGLLIGKRDFASLFVVLDSTRGVPASLAQAKEMAVPVIAYGQFLNDVITFVLVAFVVFLIIKHVNRIKSGLDRDGAAPASTRECPFCVSTISIKATRCAQCTSPL